MKKRYQAGMILGLILLFTMGISVNVWADVHTEEAIMTEKERYDPKYYKPINDSSSGKAGARSSLQTFAGESFEDKIVSALLNLEGKIDVSEYQLPVEEFKTSYYQILNDHAELYFVKAGYSGSSMNGNMISFSPIYITTDKEKIAESLIQIENAANEAVSLVTEDMEDYEKALVVHDWLAKHCGYDYKSYLNNAIPNESYTVYGALVKKQAVCEGYAKAYMYIMRQKLGITCGVLSSSSINHAWNMIKIGGSYYHVDVTWDDPVWDCIGKARHEYFLLSDDTIENGRETPHTGWESSVKAEDTTYENGYWVNSGSGIIYYDGVWYYIDNTGLKLMKTDNLLHGASEVCHTFDRWQSSSGGYWIGTYSYLWRYRNQLIFNGTNEIYSISLTTGKETVIYKPTDIPAGSGIFGFQLDGSTMQYAVQNTPNLKQDQKTFIRTVPLPGETVTGEVMIDGTLRYGSILTVRVVSQAELTGAVNYQWYSDGRVLVGETSAEYRLRASDIGKIVSVKVTYEDYIGELEQSTTAVQKAVPEQPAKVSGLKGSYGATLSTILLPEGYAWKAPDTVLNQPGNQQYTVLYTPDGTLYETIEFEVSIEVSEKPACEIHDWDEGIRTMEPTCTTAGIITYTCQKCQTVITAEIPATGHKNTEKRGQKAATCVEAGYSGDTYCTDCGEKLETGKVISATGEHQWNAGEITEAATCTTAGVKVRTCTVCGETQTEEILATGHKNTEKRGQKAATCVEAGYSGDTYCTDCGEKLETGEVVSATGHLHTEIRNKRSATITETGYTGDIYCIDCGEKLSSGMEIAISVQPPKKGSILKFGKLYYQVTKSGAKNGTVALYKYSGSVKTLKIPASVKIDGITYKVTSIAAKALKNNSKITQAEFGSNITSIGKEAFSGCKNLKKITIKSSNIKSIGKKAIWNIKKSAVIKCPSKKVNAYKKLFTAKSGYKKTMKITK